MLSEVPHFARPDAKRGSNACFLPMWKRERQCFETIPFWVILDHMGSSLVWRLRSRERGRELEEKGRLNEMGVSSSQPKRPAVDQFSSPHSLPKDADQICWKNGETGKRHAIGDKPKPIAERKQADNYTEQKTADQSSHPTGFRFSMPQPPRPMPNLDKNHPFHGAKRPAG